MGTHRDSIINDHNTSVVDRFHVSMDYIVQSQKNENAVGKKI